MKRTKALFCSILSIFFICLTSCSKEMEEMAIEISFKEKDPYGVQNLKKFDFFSSDWSWSGNKPGSLDRDMLTVMAALNDANSQTIRTTMGLGETYKGIGYYIGKNGNVGLTDEEYGPVLDVLQAIEKNNVQPYLSISYSPECVLGEGGWWKSAPDVTKFGEFSQNVEKVMQRHDINAILEILNEPDNAQFFIGSFEDYTNTYISAYNGIKAINPDRVVVGPSLAFIDNCANRIRVRHDLDNRLMDDVSYYLERVYKENAMPDAFSWHYYGQDGETEGLVEGNFSDYVNAYRRVLKSYENTEMGASLKTVQTHINEINTYVAKTTEKYMYAEIVPTMFKLMNNVLKASDISWTNFAALVGEKTDGLSYEMINGLSYERYPSYYSLWMYGRLPVFKANVHIDDPELLYYSGIDDGRCGLILCNNSKNPKKLNLKFKDIPFELTNACAYLADDTHKTCTTSNVPYIYAQSNDVDCSEGMKLEITLEPNATAYFEFNDANGTISDLDYRQTLGKYIRSDFLYDERGDNKPYSFIHQNSLSTYLGMDDNAHGKTYGSVLVKNIEKDSFKMVFETLGDLVSSNAALGFQIDYQSSNGQFKKSVIYKMNGFDAKMDIPFSNDANPTIKTFPNAQHGKVLVQLKQDAPADWNNAIRITCFIKDTGNNTSVRFQVN